MAKTRVTKKMKERTKRRAMKAKYVSRNQALRKLHISLKDFRRLCILKGIFPVVPKNTSKLKYKKDKTYFLTKDIRKIAREPILNHYNEFKNLVKRYNRARTFKKFDQAQRLMQTKNDITLDHLIKERYPDFRSALRDLDDCMNMVFLYASLPTDKRKKLYGGNIDSCERLGREFMHYVILTNSLRKVFISIKGIYYQADIYGELITWVVPYRFTQELPDDVDYAVMNTFIFFYINFLEFVNYKLFDTIGLKYPPRFAPGCDDGNTVGELQAEYLKTMNVKDTQNNIKQKNKQAKVQPDAAEVSKIQNALSHMNEILLKEKELSQAGKNDVVMSEANNNNNNQKVAIKVEDDDDESRQNMFMEIKREDDDDYFMDTTADNNNNEEKVKPETEEEKVFAESAERKIILGRAKEQQVCKTLFKNMRFYLSRETPRVSLEFVIRSFGGEVTKDENDPTMTHYICDRPSVPNMIPSREYLQPQWVYDCANYRIHLPVEQYKLDAELPPHLSPFKDLREKTEDEFGNYLIPDYVPDRAREIDAMQKEQLGLEDEEKKPMDTKADNTPPSDPLDASDVEDDEINMAVLRKEARGEKINMNKIETEKRRQDLSKSKKQEKKQIKEKQETRDLGKTMLSNKKLKLFKHVENQEKSKLEYNKHMERKAAKAKMAKEYDARKKTQTKATPAASTSSSGSQNNEQKKRKREADSNASQTNSKRAKVEPKKN